MFISDINVICAEYNELSSWWREVRSVLMESTNPFMALTGAIACRAVALYFEKEKESKVNNPSLGFKANRWIEIMK